MAKAKSLSRNLNVLVVEDSPIIRLALKSMFENLSCHVITALDGAEAVQKFNPDIDLIIMDYRLPVMEGDEAVKLIRQAEKLFSQSKNPVYILAHTAISTVEVNQILLEAGVDQVIIKPIKTEVVEEVVSRLVLTVIN